jgi:hydroxypyruvate isomerase
MNMERLKQSVPDWCFYKPQDNPEAYYRGLRKIGFTGVEMVDPARWPAAKAAGLQIVNLSSPGMTQGLNHPANHAALVPQIRSAITVAAREGIRDVIVFSGNREGQDDREGLAHTVAALRPLAAEAKAIGVTLAFEMLNSQDHADYQADKSWYGFEVVRQISSPAVKVLYDIYHMHRMGEDVLGTLLPNLRDVCHIHVAASPKRNRPTDDGEIDYRTIVRKVHAAGYRGFWGQEFLPAGDSLDELAKAFDLFNSFLA